MTTLHAFVLLVLALVLGGCERAGPEASVADPAPAAAPRPAAASEGMCEEHGVLEAVCTKCNPALVPVFQAKGDWCEEHGFPESFCPQCHPERGGRPKADVGADEAPADGTKVRFATHDIARLAGIEVAEVSERTSLTHVSATAKLVYDATKVAEVNARAPGVVRALHVDLGAKVEAGDKLATLRSAGVGADQSRLSAAKSRIQAAEANHRRLEKLRDARLAADSDVLAALQELDAAKAERASAQSALSMVGGVGGSSRYELDAPIPGVITKRNATLGRMVDLEEVLFEIVDTSSMWAEIDVSEADLARVAVGQHVTVTIDGLPDRELTGTLEYLAPEIDPHTRTVRGRVPLANPDGILRGNMFAQARIAVAGSGTAVVVPRAAVQRAKDTHLVFVRLAEDLFEARRVVLGPGDADFVEVTGRVKPGDPVVTEGSFLLKTETLRESIGAGCCEE
jgi:cobalt-zinc-cadmium efflux system membrane fusion protein